MILVPGRKVGSREEESLFINYQSSIINYFFVVVIPIPESADGQTMIVDGGTGGSEGFIDFQIMDDTMDDDSIVHRDGQTLLTQEHTTPSQLPIDKGKEWIHSCCEKNS